MDEDYALALQLQADLFEDGHASIDVNVHASHGTEPKSLVDPFWEMTDPNPDVRALFLQFNERFFWGRLAGIEVRWSPRMTLCAGLCCYEGRGGLCSVRLSVPLLKLRPRKDLVETLLHEMIHAYLFVTDNNKDHDGHGPEFHKHMYRINKEAGTNISVYHNFHDEVDALRQHWWRCDGPCRERKPYFGFVKRSMNRAPSKNDTWWAEHQRTCGGTYTKIKEPENYGKKKGKKDKDGEEEKKKVHSGYYTCRDFPNSREDIQDGYIVRLAKINNGTGKDKKGIKSKLLRLHAEQGKSSVKSMDIRTFGGEGKTLGKVHSSQSTSNTSEVPKPPVNVFKPINSIGKPQKTATISRAEDGPPSFRSENIPRSKHLPGARTPDKRCVSGNKPVSQGGTGTFSNIKKKSFDLPDFSDSDDAEDEILCSVPLENVSNTSVQSNSRNKAEPAGNIDLWWANESVIEAESDIAELDKLDKTELGVPVKVNEDEFYKNKSQSSDGDINDVRAMLRKVWGQKQFQNNNKVKVTGIFKSRNSKTEVQKTSSESSFSKDISSSHKRLSGDTELDIIQASKRRKSCNSTSIYSPGIEVTSDSEKTVEFTEPSNDSKLTSPIDKFFKKINSESPSSNESSINTGTSHKPSSSLMTDRHHSGGTTNASAEEMSVCPVCSTHVLTTSINEHLDLCLTMQAL